MHRTVGHALPKMVNAWKRPMQDSNAASSKMAAAV
jgi:hypothetical protein